nr:Wzz/FepE/Etk N-terminal domain-containing protein [Paenibacillus sp. NEAU-GSW1]
MLPYLRMVRRKWWLIMLIVIAACAAAGVKSKYYTTPIYEASAKLIVNTSSAAAQGQSVSPDVGELQTSLMLIDSYMDIIKSSAVLDKVDDQYPQLKDSAYDMSQKLSVYSINDSQVMYLKYESTSYEDAAHTVNAIANVFKQQIPSIMKVDNVTILNEAKTDGSVPQVPINTNIVMSIVVAFIISLMLGIGLVILLQLMDDTIKTEEDLKDLPGIPLLAAMGKMGKADMRGADQAKAIFKQEAGEARYASINQ